MNCKKMAWSYFPCGVSEMQFLKDGVQTVTFEHLLKVESSKRLLVIFVLFVMIVDIGRKKRIKKKTHQHLTFFVEI